MDRCSLCAIPSVVESATKLTFGTGSRHLLEKIVAIHVLRWIIRIRSTAKLAETRFARKEKTQSVHHVRNK